MTVNRAKDVANFSLAQNLQQVEHKITFFNIETWRKLLSALYLELVRKVLTHLALQLPRQDHALRSHSTLIKFCLLYCASLPLSLSCFNLYAFYVLRYC